MSDPVKTEDIEDVLSSIRRLVSEEPRPRAPRAAEAPSQPGKLVLTPAFRVAEEAANAPAPAEEEAVSEAEVEAGPAPDEGTADPVPMFVHVAAVESVSPEAEAENQDETSLRERVAELEAAVAESGGDWEPDGSEDAPQAVPLARFTIRGEREKVVEGADFDEAAEETVLDEEALREMVADIVRQELQGEMGKRITSNVRKLVRQEINRALASRDLE